MRLLLSIILALVMFLGSMIDTNHMVISCKINNYASKLTIKECYKSKKRNIERKLYGR